MWNAALRIGYTHPMIGREAEALEVFSDAFTLWGKLAADGKCAEPEVFHHLVGGGMFLIKCADFEAAAELLELEEVRHLFERASLTVEGFDVEMMSTGEHLMQNMALYGSVGAELGII